MLVMFLNFISDLFSAFLTFPIPYTFWHMFSGYHSVFNLFRKVTREWKRNSSARKNQDIRELESTLSDENYILFILVSLFLMTTYQINIKAIGFKNISGPDVFPPLYLLWLLNVKMKISFNMQNCVFTKLSF